MEVAEIDHTRGLCGQPDVPNDTPRRQLKSKPAHCRCCGSEMQVEDCTSAGMDQLGMYWLICPTCPPPKKQEGESSNEPVYL